MALARLFDFTAGSTINSSDVDSEFNQIINLLAGTSTTVDAKLTLSHATLPPLIVNQTGAGPIFQAQAAGVTVFEIENSGAFDLSHTATTAEEHAFEIDVDAAGFGDIRALEVQYETGAIATGQDEAVLLVSLNEDASTGGVVAGLEVLTTDTGSATVYGMLAGVNVGPINHQSGTFGDMDSALVNATNRLTEFTSTGSDIAMFVADDDTVTIGDAAQFTEIEFILSTVASGAGVKPTFEFSTGVGTWTTFTPTDGTNGFRSSGTVAWLLSDISGTWAVGTGSEYLIRITRTQNTLTTVPIEDIVKIALATQYAWDSSGDVNINDLTVAGTLAVTGAVTFTDATITLGGIAYEWPADNGDAGEQLQTDGAGNLTWEAADSVDTTGTPANNQVATFTDTNTIQGESGLTFDGSTLTVTGDVQISGTTPFVTIGDGGEEDTGIVFNGAAADFYIAIDDTDDLLHIGGGSTVGTATEIKMDGGGTITIVGTVQANNANGYGLSASASSTTVPTLLPNRADGDSGMGSVSGSDDLNIISGGVEAMRFTEAASAVATLIPAGTLRVGAAGTNDGHMHVLSGAVGTPAGIFEMPASASENNLKLQYNGTVAIQFETKAGGTSIRTVAADLGNDALGTGIFLERNSNGTSAGASFLAHTDRGNQRYYTWVDDAGNCRVGTTAPIGSQDTSGTVVGTQTSWHHQKDYTPATLTPTIALDRINALSLYDYTYKDDPSKVEYTGLVGFGRNDWYLTNIENQQIPVLDTRTIIGHLVAAVQRLTTRIGALEP